MRELHGRRILLGISGGIAAYKVGYLVRGLRKAGASVRVVMTATAMKFVGPLTFEALSENPVGTDDDFFHTGGGVSHVEIARSSDLVVIAPCTATTLARLANGLADNLLSAVVLASRAPVLLVPSMHTAMWESYAVRQNLGRLDPQRFVVMTPSAGDLASGDSGPGRFPETDEIIETAARTLGPRDLEGTTIAVTAGPTREFIDPVRLITNPSTGRMGIEIARAALRRGAVVRLVLGPTEVLPPAPIEGASLAVTRVTNCNQMLQATRTAVDGADVLVMAAAPSDQAPAAPRETKAKKEDLASSVDLVSTPDILKTLRPLLAGKFVMGFAAETGDIEASGRRKLDDKGLDLLFANPVGTDRGFGARPNEGWLIGRDAPSETVPPMAKRELADLLLDRIATALQDAKNRKA
jgi:phosphopantothenoylcysteine decarboxylase/phosphopantothenate--cysteine ligase